MTRRRKALLFALPLALAAGALLLLRPAPPSVAEAIAAGADGCIACHGPRADPGEAHGHVAMGCVVCHGGDPGKADEAGGHAGLVRYSGNLDVVDRTCGICHAEAVARVRASPMATARGMVAVQRFAFGEQEAPDGLDTLADRHGSPADEALGQLCADCHVGHPRTSPGQTIGGGCSACHSRPSATPGAHPRVTSNVGSEPCRGCHSRSSRIALSYEGWHETDRTEAEGRAEGMRMLPDGRALSKQPADVHFARGLTCVDCHTAREIMGDGRVLTHQEQAIEIACVDCHRVTPAVTLTGEALDASSRALLRANAALPREASAFVTTARGTAYTNLVIEEGAPVLVRKLDGARLSPRPPAAACLDPLHARLACQSCHAGWAPQCLGCHTARGEDGRFTESAGEFFAEPPTLGVRATPSAPTGSPATPAGAPAAPPGFPAAPPGSAAAPEPPAEQIVPVVPGMIFTLALPGEAERFSRLFAPIAPHTTQRAGRSCASCHDEPLAVGLGRGTFAAPDDITSFTPRYGPLRDGLPADAWVGLASGGGGATRVDLRPFTIEERARIVGVGQRAAGWTGIGTVPVPPPRPGPASLHE